MFFNVLYCHLGWNSFLLSCRVQKMIYYELMATNKKIETKYNRSFSVFAFFLPSQIRINVKTYLVCATLSIAACTKCNQFSRDFTVFAKPIIT